MGVGKFSVILPGGVGSATHVVEGKRGLILTMTQEQTSLGRPSRKKREGAKGFLVVLERLGERLGERRACGGGNFVSQVICIHSCCF